MHFRKKDDSISVQLSRRQVESEQRVVELTNELRSIQQSLSLPELQASIETDDVFTSTQISVSFGCSKVASFYSHEYHSNVLIDSDVTVGYCRS